MKEQTILFSIIIPTYNRAKLLKQAVQNVLAQDFKQLEIIIVDDGSTDDTIEVIRNFDLESIKYFKQENAGQSAARNRGVEKAVGDYVIFLDDDDYWLPGHLEQFVQAIQEEESQICIFRTGFKRIYSDGREVMGADYKEEKKVHPVHWATFNMCGLWTLCIPRIALQQNHSPIGFPHWQDTHLILRLFAQFPLCQLPNATYAYRVHEQMGSLQNADQLLARAEKNTQAMEDLFEHHGDLIQPFLPEDTLNFLIAEKYIDYANLELKVGSRKTHWTMLRRSLKARFDLRLWKYYVLFVKNLWPGKKA